LVIVAGTPSGQNPAAVAASRQRGDPMSEAGPVFNQFNLVVRDMDATVAFYRRLGLTILDTDPVWAQHHRNAVMPDGIDLDFDSVEFAQQWNTGWSGRAGGATGVLGFGLPSRDAVDGLHAELTGAGYGSQQEPSDAFWGARYAVVEDPDGNAVGLMSPIDPQRKTQPKLR
jgi:catechol 2,3-dioxygenase-like lactoylglutathione lyase family enzyme